MSDHVLPKKFVRLLLTPLDSDGNVRGEPSEFHGVDRFTYSDNGSEVVIEAFYYTPTTTITNLDLGWMAIGTLDGKLVEMGEND